MPRRISPFGSPGKLISGKAKQGSVAAAVGGQSVRPACVATIAAGLNTWWFWLSEPAPKPDMMLSPRATNEVKSALPRAANDGEAIAAASSATAAMRAKVLMRFIGVLLWPCLEPVSQVQADQVCVGVIRPVHIGAAALRAALLEVKDELGGVDGPVAPAVADAEGDPFAVGVREQRADCLDRLRVLVVHRAEADIPLRVDHVVRAEAVGHRVIPVLRAIDQRGAGGVAGHGQTLEAAPGGVGHVEFDVPVRNGRAGHADRGDGREGDGGLHALAGREAGPDQAVEDRVAGGDLRDGEVAFEVDVHVGATGSADAPRSRLEQHADVPGRAALPVA